MKLDTINPRDLVRVICNDFYGSTGEVLATFDNVAIVEFSEIKDQPVESDFFKFHELEKIGELEMA